MTVLLSVDLAAKFSAVVLRGAGGGVTAQFDSRDKRPLQFLREIADMALVYEVDMIVVEDVPYGISNQSMIKPVLRLQGALCAYLTAMRCLDRTWFVSPSLWMKDFSGVQLVPKGYTKAAADTYRIEQARMYPERGGYSPPDLVSEYEKNCQGLGKKILKKDTNPLAKSMTDYVSAWLMSEWALGHDFTIPNKLAQEAKL